MKIIAREEIEVFGEKMIAELVEYDIDITNTSAPYKMIDGEYRYTTKRKVRVVRQPEFLKFDVSKQKGVKHE